MEDFYPDKLSFGGANYLANKIRRYWRGRGLNPRVRVESMGGDNSKYQVRSNMVGGQPCSEP